jgi:hypothetical protein
MPMTPSKPISHAEARVSFGEPSKVSLKRIGAAGLARIDCNRARRSSRRRSAKVGAVVRPDVEDELIRRTQRLATYPALR